MLGLTLSSIYSRPDLEAGFKGIEVRRTLYNFQGELSVISQIAQGNFESITLANPIFGQLLRLSTKSPYSSHSAEEFELVDYHSTNFLKQFLEGFEIENISKLHLGDGFFEDLYGFAISKYEQLASRYSSADIRKIFSEKDMTIEKLVLTEAAIYSFCVNFQYMISAGKFMGDEFSIFKIIFQSLAQIELEKERIHSQNGKGEDEMIKNIRFKKRRWEELYRLFEN